MALPKPQVEKDLGEIIVANNPGPGLMQPTSASATTFKPPKGFTSWSALPGELTALLPSLGLSLPQPPYRVRVLRSASQPLQGRKRTGATSQTELALELVDTELALMPFPLQDAERD